MTPVFLNLTQRATPSIGCKGALLTWRPRRRSLHTSVGLPSGEVNSQVVPGAYGSGRSASRSI